MYYNTDGEESGGTGLLRKIVVGVTRDEAAEKVLGWAARAATRNDALLVIVTVCKPPRALLTISGWAYIDTSDAEAAARFLQNDVLHSSLRADARLRMRPVVARGDPVGVLVAASKDADLLVVGRRASRLRRLLGGSVSRGCTNRSACPVVIVRSDAADPESSEPTPGPPRTPINEGPRSTVVHASVDNHRHRTRRHPQFEFRRRTL